MPLADRPAGLLDPPAEPSTSSGGVQPVAATVRPRPADWADEHAPPEEENEGQNAVSVDEERILDDEDDGHGGGLDAVVPPPEPASATASLHLTQ